jgi:ribosome-binding protein aMBF1 (putative translation factor)
MDNEKRKALEAAGFRVSTVREFLGLSEEEDQIVELRVALARRVRELREGKHLTQQQLASKLGSSQSRVAKIESADSGVSFDLMFRGFFALGGKVADLAKATTPRPARPK